MFDLGGSHVHHRDWVPILKEWRELLKSVTWLSTFDLVLQTEILTILNFLIYSSLLILEFTVQ